jgi:hypothetical protein
MQSQLHTDSKRLQTDKQRQWNPQAQIAAHGGEYEHDRYELVPRLSHSEGFQLTSKIAIAIIAQLNHC